MILDTYVGRILERSYVVCGTCSVVGCGAKFEAFNEKGYLVVGDSVVGELTT